MAVLEFFRTTSALVPAGTSISRTADLDLAVFRERETLILPYLVSNEVEARLSQPICGRTEKVSKAGVKGATPQTFWPSSMMLAPDQAWLLEFVQFQCS